MRSRYVLATGGDDPTDAARNWALTHAERDKVPLVPVQVTPQPPDSKSLTQLVRDDDILVVDAGKTGAIRTRVFGSRVLQVASSAPCSVAIIPPVDLRFRSGVVAGVENDDQWRGIVEAAAEEASARVEHLHIVHSTFSGFVPATVEIGTPALERAATLVKARWPHLIVRTHSSVRSPAEALLEASRKSALLVLGRGSERTVGSVTQHVLANINAPVLIVRHSHQTTTGEQ